MTGTESPTEKKDRLILPGSLQAPSSSSPPRNGGRRWGNLLWGPNTLKKQDSGLSYDDVNMNKKRTMMEDDDISFGTTNVHHTSSNDDSQCGSSSAGGSATPTSSNHNSLHGSNNVLSYDEDEEDELQKIIEQDDEGSEQDEKSLSSDLSSGSRTNALRGLWGRFRATPQKASAAVTSTKNGDVVNDSLLDKNKADNSQPTTIEITDSNITEPRNNISPEHFDNEEKEKDDEHDIHKANNAGYEETKSLTSNNNNTAPYNDEVVKTNHDNNKNNHNVVKMEGIGALPDPNDDKPDNNAAGMSNIFRSINKRRLQAKMDLNPEHLTKEELAELQEDIKDLDSTTNMDKMETRITTFLEDKDAQSESRRNMLNEMNSNDQPRSNSWVNRVKTLTSAVLAPEVFVDTLIDEEQGENNLGYYRRVLPTKDEIEDHGELDGKKDTAMRKMRVSSEKERCFEFTLDDYDDYDDDMIPDDGYRKVKAMEPESEDEEEDEEYKSMDKKEIIRAKKKLEVKLKELTAQVVSLESALEDKEEEAKMWKNTALYLQEQKREEMTLSIGDKKEEEEDDERPTIV